MAITAGDIQEITYNHPTLGSGTFKPIAGEDFSINLGGRRGLDEVVLTSDGEAIHKVQNMPWSMEGPVRWAATIGLDMEKLAGLSGDLEDTNWTIQLISGEIYGGIGRPVGDIVGSSKDGQIPLKVVGGNGLRQL
jgi:hypothetical protein